MLFTFPSRYLFAIGLTGVFSLAGWARRIQAGFLVSRPTQDAARKNACSRKGLSPAPAAFSKTFRSSHSFLIRGPTTPDAPKRARFRLFPGRSPLLGESLTYFLFLPVLRCFSSRRWPPLLISWMPGLQPGGLSHSGIPGSTAICASPGLFAAYRALRRLREPRHPPCALFLLLAQACYSLSVSSCSRSVTRIKFCRPICQRPFG